MPGDFKRFSTAFSFKRLALIGVLLVPVCAAAQTPFPPQALLDATNPQQAIAVLGAAQAERSTHLLIDAPEVTPAGAFKVTIRSEIPGTSMLVLLRSSWAPAGSSALPPQKLVVFAERLKPGALATTTLELAADGPQILALYAFARGRWFNVTREIKLGKSMRAD